MRWQGGAWRAISIAAIVAQCRVAAADPQHLAELYLNRCTGGCTVHAGADDATTLTSSIPSQMSTLAAFTDDTAWAALVVCVTETLSPYAITVSDSPPAPGVLFDEVIVAGTPGDLGLADGTAVIAPITDCIAATNSLAFAFPAQAFLRADDLCWAVARDAGYLFGLEANDALPAAATSCNEIMSAEAATCGAPRWFCNQPQPCPTCRCDDAQSSHARLLAVLGAGVSTIPPPTASISMPAAGDLVVDGAPIFAAAGAPRGVASIELWLNGTKWASQPGAACGLADPPAPYTLVLPEGVPDSILDITIKAFDDLGAEGDATVTVTKGAPCVDASTCATGQLCDNGRCYWTPPTGALGDACTYDQFCTSSMCVTSSAGMRCSQPCIPGATDACPPGFTCDEAGDSVDGVCVPASSGGGCATGGGTGSGCSALVVAACGLVVARARRRRRVTAA